MPKLLGIEQVQPKRFPLDGKRKWTREIIRHALPPLVLPLEHQTSRATGVPDVPCHPRQHFGLSLLREPPVVPTIGMDVGNPPTGRQAIFRDQQGDSGVMSLQIEKVADISVRPHVVLCFRVFRIVEEKVGPVGVHMVGGEQSGNKRRSGAEFHDIQGDGVGVVQEFRNGLIDRLPPLAADPDLLGVVRLRHMMHRIQRRPIDDGQRALAGVLPGFVPDRKVRHFGEPDFGRIPGFNADVLP